MEVYYKPELRSPSVGGSTLLNGIRLNQGLNEIDRSQLKALKIHPEFNSFLAQGVICLGLEKEETENVTDAVIFEPEEVKDFGDFD